MIRNFFIDVFLISIFSIACGLYPNALQRPAKPAKGWAGAVSFWILFVIYQRYI